MTHSTQCGFAGFLRVFLPWNKVTSSLGDPAGGHVALQEAKSHRCRPKISLISGKKGKGSRDPEKSLD